MELAKVKFYCRDAEWWAEDEKGKECSIPIPLVKGFLRPERKEWSGTVGVEGDRVIEFWG